jgi:hypothetical protein
MTRTELLDRLDVLLGRRTFSAKEWGSPSPASLTSDR